MDWISDSMTRIRNAIMVKKTTVKVRGTKQVLDILKVMKKEGFIGGYNMEEIPSFQQSCVINLLYSGSQSVIREIKIKSKPSLPVYISSQELKYFLKRFAMPIVSTSKGVLSGTEAIDAKVGGKLICEVS